MQPQKDLMLSRRQKTLSSISNYIPIHILLNRPAGVSFSLTVPKSFTIEQLARQIEAEYAYLVEREVGNSSYPVIECGALFDHVDLPRRDRRRLTLRQRLQQEDDQQQHTPRGIRAPLPTVPPQDKTPEDAECGSVENETLEQDDGQREEDEKDQCNDVDREEDDRELEKETAEAGNEDGCHDVEHNSDEEAASDEDEDEDEEDEDEDDDDDMIDEREEAESRGVQLRFSDKVEDVLERDSTVHVVNIDQ
ncbi:hypothetical protein BGZ72_009996, partial [Mortierella alpina]